MKKMAIMISAIMISGISFSSEISKRENYKIDVDKKIMMFGSDEIKKAEIGKSGAKKNNTLEKKLETTENAFKVDMSAKYYDIDSNDKYDKELLGFGEKPNEIDIIAAENKKLRSYYARVEAMERAKSE